MNAVPFTQQNVDASPAQPGVYALFRSQELTYIGSSEVSIRGRLQRHLSGDEGYCTQVSTHVWWEVCSNPKEREKQLLEAHKKAHGKLPRCNELMPS